MKNDRQIANDLNRYMIFRADQEGVAYNLNPEYFLNALRMGVTNFFGISIDDSGLEADEQNPKAFAEWQRVHTTH